jgi:hypothetical protein
MGVAVNHWLVEFDSLMRSQVPVTTFQKVACGFDNDPVAMAPSAQLDADNIAAWTLRSKSLISVRTG